MVSQIWIQTKKISLISAVNQAIVIIDVCPIDGATDILSAIRFCVMDITIFNNNPHSMILGNLAACSVEHHFDGTRSVQTHEVIPVRNLDEIPVMEAFMLKYFVPKDQPLILSRKSVVIFMPTEKNFTGYVTKVDDLKGMGC